MSLRPPLDQYTILSYINPPQQCIIFICLYKKYVWKTSVRFIGILKGKKKKAVHWSKLSRSGFQLFLVCQISLEHLRLTLHLLAPGLKRGTAAEVHCVFMLPVPRACVAAIVLAQTRRQAFRWVSCVSGLPSYGPLMCGLATVWWSTSQALWHRRIGLLLTHWRWAAVWKSDSAHHLKVLECEKHLFKLSMVEVDVWGNVIRRWIVLQITVTVIVRGEKGKLVY